MYFDNVKMFDIEKNISNLEHIYAHKKVVYNEFKDKVIQRELLSKHLDLTVSYLYNIINKKNLDQVLLNIEKALLRNRASFASTLYKELLLNVFIFHDIGKIIIPFQVNEDKMDSNYFEYEGPAKANHSPLSSVLYFDYYYEKIYEHYENDDISDEDFYFLCFILQINTYLINQHHGGLDNFDKYKENTLFKHLNNFIEFKDYRELFECNYNRDFFVDLKSDKHIILDETHKYMMTYKKDKKLEISFFVYSRLIFSMLKTCDVYSTYEYENDTKVEDLGLFDSNSLATLKSEFEDQEIIHFINKYRLFLKGVIKENPYSEDSDSVKLNELRTKIFLESERTLLENLDKNIFYLEAPTGSGKTIIAINLVLNILLNNKDINKYIHVAPYNTLLEQTKNSLKESFVGVANFDDLISVLNSITSIKTILKERKSENEDIEDNEEDDINFEESLLSHNFINYPILLTSHVRLFKFLFGHKKEDLCPLVGLCNSVIVLDEIQSYKNSIWKETILFLEEYASLLNIKIIIMSATLPRLSYFIKDSSFVNLINNPSIYFQNRLFKDRVQLDYSFLDKKSETLEDDLFDMIVKIAKTKDNDINKILTCFLTKPRAEVFYERFKETLKGENVKVFLITGKTPLPERKQILSQIKKSKDEKIILVSTQVIQAGINIDMDIGFKDISTLDEEEQFIGRINRFFLKNNSKVYFFNLDDVRKIYINDFRTRKEITLENVKTRKILEDKNFIEFFQVVMEDIELNRSNKSSCSTSLSEFMDSKVNTLIYKEIENRLKLIEDDNSISVFINREIELEDGTFLKGYEVWDELKDICNNYKITYAEREFKKSKIMEKATYFIVNMRKWTNSYNDIINNIMYIEDGDKYIKNGVVNEQYIDWCADII